MIWEYALVGPKIGLEIRLGTSGVLRLEQGIGYSGVGHSMLEIF